MHPPPYMPDGLLVQLQEVSLLGKPLVADGALTPTGVGAYWALISCVVCTIAYTASRFYTPLYFKGYRRLSIADQRDWDTRFINIVFAAYIVSVAVRLVALDDLFWKPDSVPMLFRSHPDSVAALGVAVGFFGWELVITLRYWLGGGAMVVHHVGSLACVATALLTGQGHCPTLWMLSTEATTPFIALRFLLDKGGFKAHPIYALNGLVILAAWTVFRISSFPPFFVTTWRDMETIASLNTFSQTLLICFPVVLFGLNCFWYSKVLVGVYKVLGFGKKKTEQKEEKAD